MSPPSRRSRRSRPAWRSQPAFPRHHSTPESGTRAPASLAHETYSRGPRPGASFSGGRSGGMPRLARGHGAVMGYVEDTFERDTDYISDRITADGRQGWTVEPGRYRLIAARACPWA